MRSTLSNREALYRRLHRLADAKRLHRKGHVESLRGQLQATPARHLELIVAEIARDEARDRAILERQAALAISIHRAGRASGARAQGKAVRRLRGVLASYTEPK